MRTPKSNLEDSDQKLSDHDLKLTDRKIKPAIGHADRDRKGSDYMIDLKIGQWKQLERDFTWKELKMLLVKDPGFRYSSQSYFGR